MWKEDFIQIYPGVHQQALSSSNIQSGFAAAGLIPLSLERVLSKILKTPTPPSTSHSNQSFGIGQTPANIYQLEEQKKKIRYLKETVSPSVVDDVRERPKLVQLIDHCVTEYLKLKKKRKF